MLRVLKSHSAAERIAAAVEFIASFPPATELLLVGYSREGVDDLVSGFSQSQGATFGLHRFSLTQLAALIRTEDSLHEHAAVLIGEHRTNKSA